MASSPESHCILRAWLQVFPVNSDESPAGGPNLFSSDSFTTWESPS